MSPFVYWEPSAADIERFRRDGILVVERILDPDWARGISRRYLGGVT